MIGDVSRKKCVYSVPHRSLPVMKAIKKKIEYCRSHPGASLNYVIEYKTDHEPILAILREIVQTRTGKTCDQEFVVVRLIYKDELNDLPVEAVVTHLCASSRGEYSLRGLFQEVKDDV